MAKTEVILCDICKKQVANLKCSLCEKDLCTGQCSSNYSINLGVDNNLNIYFCYNNCYDKVAGFMRRLDKESKTQLFRDVRKIFLTFVKKGIVLDKLDENGEKRKE